jgi:hypothetical protein
MLDQNIGVSRASHRGVAASKVDLTLKGDILLKSGTDFAIGTNVFKFGTTGRKGIILGLRD